MDNTVKIVSNPFNRIPDEIMYNIFTFLDKTSIKNFALSFKRAAVILSLSSNLINKFFKLKLHHDFWINKEKILEVLFLTRNLCEIDLANIAGNHNVLIAIFHRHGGNVTKLKISNSSIDDFTLREILRLSPKVKDLNFSEVIIIKKLPAINSMFMSNLVKLSIEYCDWEVFKFIMRSQLKSLEVKSYFDEGNRKHLVDFLSSQFTLKELTLHGTSIRSLFCSKDVNNICAYSLHSLSIDYTIGKNSDAVNWNINTFLSLHEETLKNVEISGPNNEHIAAFTLLNLNMLTDLTIDVRSLPKDQNFYNVLAEMRSPVLQNLKLRGFFFQHELIKSILFKFPLIRNLEINDWSNGSVSDLLFFISENLVHLGNLTLTEISCSENIKFKALTNLTVQYFRNATKLSSFINQNDKIISLKIGLIYIEQTATLVQCLRGLNNLKYLSIGGNKRALKKILNLIHFDAPENLETLELFPINDERNSYNTACMGIKFNLPFDQRELNMKIKVLMY